MSDEVPEYCGVYAAGTQYDANSLVTCRGGLWSATIDAAATTGG